MLCQEGGTRGHLLYGLLGQLLPWYGRLCVTIVKDFFHVGSRALGNGLAYGKKDSHQFIGQLLALAESTVMDQLEQSPGVFKPSV